MSSVLPVLSVLKEERLFPASNQNEGNPEQKDNNPEVVPSNSSLKPKASVKFKEKDDGHHMKAANAHTKSKQTKLSLYFTTPGQQ